MSRRKQSEKKQQDYLSLTGVQKLLRLRFETVRDLAESGQLPGRRFGKNWRFNRQDIDAWMRTGNQKEMNP